MKVKILLIPLTVVIIVAVLIWLVYPAYSNGVDGVKENYAKLKIEQKKLKELQAKNQNISTLSSQIDSLAEKDILYSFVPELVKEEEIINDLIGLSALSSLFLSESNISQPEKDSIVEMALATPIPTDLNGMPTGALQVNALPKTREFKNVIKINGSYEKIKEFLANIGKMERSSKFEALDIQKDVVAGSTNLLVSATINFNVLKKAKLSEQNMSDPVFSNPKLDIKIIEDIKNQKGTNNFPLTIDQKGKNNPFQP